VLYRYRSSRYHNCWTSATTIEQISQVSQPYMRAVKPTVELEIT